MITILWTIITLNYEHQFLGIFYAMIWDDKILAEMLIAFTFKYKIRRRRLIHKLYCFLLIFLKPDNHCHSPRPSLHGLLLGSQHREQYFFEKYNLGRKVEAGPAIGIFPAAGCGLPDQHGLYWMTTLDIISVTYCWQSAVKCWYWGTLQSEAAALQKAQNTSSQSHLILYITLTLL